jgi:hypothetical protein
MALNTAQIINYIFSSLDEGQQKKGCFGMKDCGAIVNSANLLGKYTELGQTSILEGGSARNVNNQLHPDSHGKARDALSILVECCNVLQHKGGFSILESQKLLGFLENIEQEILKIKTESLKKPKVEEITEELKELTTSTNIKIEKKLLIGESFAETIKIANID